MNGRHSLFVRFLAEKRKDESLAKMQKKQSEEAPRKKRGKR